MVGLGGWVPVVPSPPAPASASGVQEVARELPDLRTEFSKTFANTDGTRTTFVSTRPVHFATAAGWTPIDMTLVSDAGTGLLRTVANGWSATFAPDGVRVRDGDGELALLPVGASTPAPAPQLGVDRTTVTYTGVWPGVDLRYRVFPDEVKEEIVLTRRPDRNAFAFATVTPLEADPAVPGGLVPAGPLAGTWHVPPPEVLDGRGVPVDGAVASFTASGAHVAVNVDAAWLDALAPSDYPVVVDPTYVRGLSRSYAYRQSGAYCGSSCPVRIGNPDASWRTWRSAVHFPYEPLFGKKVVHAQVEAWGLSAGTVTNFPSDLYHSTGDNWHSVRELLVDDANGGGNYVYTSAALTAFYDSLLSQRTAGASLKFVGDESGPGRMSYKQFDSFQLRLDWTERPPVLTGSPAAGPNPIHQGDPTTVSQAWSHPTDQARLFVCKAPGVTTGGCTAGTWGSSGWTTARTAHAEFEPDAVVGTQRYWTYVCSASLCSAAGEGSFDVLNLPPTNVGTIKHSPDAVREGQRISFAVPFWDYSGKARAVICKTDDANSGSCAAGQRWTNNGPLGDSPAVSYLEMPMETTAGKHAYYAFACDGDGGCSPSRRGTFTVHDPATPTSVTADPDPADPGDRVTLTVAWDRSTEANKAVVCRSDAITQGKATCPGGTLAAGELATSSPSTASFTPTSAEAGVLAFHVFMCTAANACSARPLAGTLQVNDTTDPSTAKMQPSAQVVNVAGTAHLDVQVEKLTGGPLRGRPVTFSSVGANPSTGHGTTSLGGQAAYSYQGANVGPDVVRFQVDDVPMATAAAVVMWRPTTNDAFATEVVFDPPSAPADRVTRGVPVTVTFQALTATGAPFDGIVRYGVGPFGALPAKVLTTTVRAAENGRGTITFTPTTAGVWQVFASADRAAPDGVFGVQDANELDGATAVVAQEPCGTSRAVAAIGSGVVEQGGTASVTALVVDNCGQRTAGVPVTFVRAGVNPGTGTATTDHEGLATHEWTGAAAGVDTVDASAAGAVAPATALVVWREPPPPPPSTYAVTLTPPTQAPMLGETAQLRAHVASAEDGTPVAGATVLFTRQGVNGASENAATTDAAGDALFSYAGATAGPDTVTAQVMDAVEVAGDGVAPSVAAATVVWRGEPPSVPLYVVTLSAPQTAPLGSEVAVTATVTAAAAVPAPVPGVLVRFERSGASGAETVNVMTGAGGQATYRYTGGTEGLDAVTAVVTASPTAAASTAVLWLPAPAPPAAGAGARARGYWLVAADGGVFAMGGAPFHGSTGGTVLNEPIVGMAPSDDGYWFVAADGGVFSFGDAAFHGSTGDVALNQPIVGMAATAAGRGYWLVARDGGVFAFGDAAFLGSTGALVLNQPIVGMVGTPSGRGYWLVARDGGVFAFGDAPFLGSTGALRLNQPIVGMAATATGRGYWFAGADGGVFAFGDASFLGSAAGAATSRIVGITSTPTGRGYLLAAADGSTYAFGDAVPAGSTPPLARPIVGAATAR